jgi:hypothetical protein
METQTYMEIRRFFIRYPIMKTGKSSVIEYKDVKLPLLLFILYIKPPGVSQLLTNLYAL